MRPQSAKAKGRRLQAEIVADILAMNPELGDGDVSYTSMSVAGPDVKLSPFARTLFPFAVEAKNRESLDIWDALAQTERYATDELEPLLVFRRNRSRPYAVVSWSYFLNLVRGAYGPKAAGS